MELRARPPAGGGRHPRRASQAQRSRYIARYQLGQVYEEMGRKAYAARQYESFLTGWANADPGWPQVEDARRRLAALRAGS